MTARRSTDVLVLIDRPLAAEARAEASALRREITRRGLSVRALAWDAPEASVHAADVALVRSAAAPRAALLAWMAHAEGSMELVNGVQALAADPVAMRAALAAAGVPLAAHDAALPCTSLFLIDGVCSHAVRAEPGKPSRLMSPSTAELLLAHQAFRAGPLDLTYARVDVVTDGADLGVAALDPLPRLLHVRHGTRVVSRVVDAVCARLRDRRGCATFARADRTAAVPAPSADHDA